MSTLIEKLLKRDFTVLEEDPQIDNDNPLSLYLIISAIQQSQFEEAIPWFLDNILAAPGYCDPEARLFMRPELPLDMITFVVNAAAARFSLVGVIDSLISLESSDDVFDACTRAFAVLGDTEFASWVNFANEADYQGNQMVWMFCQNQARRVAPFAERPPYMKEYTEGGLTKDYKFEPSDDDTLEEICKKRAEDPELFRILGPSNLLFNALESDILDGSADLRLFTDDRLTPEEQVTWFTGSCDQCWLRIKSSRYAVRKPLEEGGWKGQFCSWDCVRINCEDFEAVPRAMTEYYEKQCKDYGVYDHLFSTIGRDEDEVDDL